MKTLYALAISMLLPMLCRAADTNGFLVFKIERFAYSTRDGKPTEPETKQSFKIPLTAEFLSNFKNHPNDHSSGTGFVCTSDFEKPRDNAPHFMWWLTRISDHRWYIHMWASLRNPSTTQSVTIKNLEDLDMSYQDSYVNMPKGVNVSFSAKYMSAEQIEREGPMPIPVAPVKKADQSVLFQGDALTNCPVVLSGSFQEN